MKGKTFTKRDLVKSQREMNKLCAKKDLDEEEKIALRILFKNVFEAFLEEQNIDHLSKSREQGFYGFNTYRLDTPLGAQSSAALSELNEALVVAWTIACGKTETV